MNTPRVAPTPIETLSPSLSPGAENQPEIDADLQLVIDRWDDLPADVRRTILHVVKASVEATKQTK